MAHAPGTPARFQRLSSLVAIVAVAVAISLAFGRILQGSGAAWRLLGVGVASGVIAWATERRGMLLATLCSAAGLLLALTWFAAPQTTWFGLPTTETLRTLGSLATQVGRPGARLHLPRARHPRADPCRHHRRLGRGVLVLCARVPRPEPACSP